MDTPTAPNDWRTVLREQGRTIAWLAKQTGRPARTVYAYSRGQLTATPEWLADASVALGVQVADTLVVTVIKQYADGSAA